MLNTGTKNLVESSYDDLWGTGIPLSDPAALDESRWKTVGLLGKMLMSVRSEKNLPVSVGMMKHQWKKVFPQLAIKSIMQCGNISYVETVEIVIHCGNNIFLT